MLHSLAKRQSARSVLQSLLLILYPRILDWIVYSIIFATICVWSSQGYHILAYGSGFAIQHIARSDMSFKIVTEKSQVAPLAYVHRC